MTSELTNPTPLISPTENNKETTEDFSQVTAAPESCFKKKFPVVFAISFSTILLVLTLVIGGIVSKDKVNSMSFLYVNDFHIDTKYDEYSLASRDILCRAPVNKTDIPRPFGQYKCDAPVKVFKSLVNYLPKAVSKPGFILFGGDALGHRLDLDADGVRDKIQELITDLEKKYPNVPVLFTFGNNDFAENYGALETDAGDFNNMLSIFGKHMDDQEKETFKKGGYYYKDFPGMKLRLFMLNTILYSYFREYNESIPDPHGQFAWLKEKCSEATKLGYKIGLAMHSPPGVSYFNYKQGWYQQYVDQFNAIIRQFDIEFSVVAHTHLDLIMPLSTETNSEGLLTYALSAPAVSSAHRNNPSFRVYYLEDGTLMDYDQYYADIMLNPQDDLPWELEYTFSKEYGTNDLSKKSINKAIEWIRTTGKGQWKYREHIYSRADDENSFYYCILKSVTGEEAQKCHSGLNTKRLYPYGFLDE